MKSRVRKKADNVYEIPKSGKMNVHGIVYASDKLIKNIEKDKTLEQIKNVAKLQGIIEKSIAMPDAHQGYGFPIGGVAAFDLKKGIISPGGVGYDINCGVRLIATDINKNKFMGKRKKIVEEIFNAIPAGVGKKSDFRFKDKEIKKILEQGVNWLVGEGYALKKDLDKIEDNGSILGANASMISQKAIGRGMNQLGTLGAGNHFLEIQEVEEIFDKKTARTFGLRRGQIVIMIHSGSRGLGHQVASDYIKKMELEYGFKDLPDRELICAPIDSKLGKEYISAMNCAANFAFANRQFMTYQLRKIFDDILGARLKIIYDIAHNIAKFEKHKVDGKMKEVCVHRKGATRSFGPGRKEIPKIYRKVGSPIFIPGSMGTYSYVLVGTKEAEKLSWGSTAHGAGRVMSRKKAMNELSQKEVEKEMEERDVLLKSNSLKGILEEAPEAYKDVNDVVKVSNELGIGKLVAKLRPLAVVKG